MLFKQPLKLPLEMSELQVVLENKSKKAADSSAAPSLLTEPMMIVDYNKSTLRGKFFINYVSNLKLSIFLSKDGMSKEDRFDLLKEYMVATSVSEIYTLADTIAVMLLESKGMKVESDGLWLSEDERLEFFNENKEICDTWILFLDSILMCMPFCVETYSQSYGKKLIENGAVQVINDANYIGKNVAILLATTGYLETYLSLDIKTTPVLFEAQWFEPVFSGYSIMSILNSHESTLFPFMVSLFEQWLPEEDLKKALGYAA